MTESQWIVLAGVVTAVVGSLVAAPDGTLLILRGTASGARKVQGWWPRRGVTHRTGTGTATLNLGAPIMSASATVTRNPGTPFMEQIRRLWAITDELQRQLGAVRQEVNQSEARLTSAIETASAELREALKQLSDRLEEQERQSARIDARGLPLVGLGILLTGEPGALAAWGWPGWVLITMSAGLVTWLALVPSARWVFGRLRS